MPAKDKFHDAVKNALVKEGWTITNDPLTFKIDGINISIDLGAEKIIGFSRGTWTIFELPPIFG